MKNGFLLFKMFCFLALLLHTVKTSHQLRFILNLTVDRFLLLPSLFHLIRSLTEFPSNYRVQTVEKGCALFSAPNKSNATSRVRRIKPTRERKKVELFCVTTVSLLEKLERMRNLPSKIILNSAFSVYSFDLRANKENVSFLSLSVCSTFDCESRVKRIVVHVIADCDQILLLFSFSIPSFGRKSSNFSLYDE